MAKLLSFPSVRPSGTTWLTGSKASKPAGRAQTFSASFFMYHLREDGRKEGEREGESESGSGLA